MATVNVQGGGSNLGTALSQFLLCDEIMPGSPPGYETCKTILLFHPLGAKMAEAPIRSAQSMQRTITVSDGPEDDLVKAFGERWKADEATKIIRNVGTQARVYGIASLAVLEKGVDPSTPVDVKKIADAELSFNVLDPLNTAGSLVLNQDPNALDFQKHRDIAVSGTIYHRSRTVTLMNEQPIYISYTPSAFGFVGRSVYQRALFPLKSYVQTMQADDLVARKVGLIVATLKMVGSIIDAVQAAGQRFKRDILKIGVTDNVISINKDEKIESLDLKNLEGPLQASRKNILENIAAADDMPAVMLNNETFAEGFGEGTEDAKRVAAYLGNIRDWLEPLYCFMTMIVQRRAWNAEFYKTMQAKYPDQYRGVSYEVAFYRWVNSFAAGWPSLLQEPESEQIKVAETKFKTAVAVTQILLPEMDPINKATTVRWLADTVNNAKELFPVPLDLDYDALMAYTPPQPTEEDKEPGEAPPFSARDSANGADVLPLQRRIERVERVLGAARRRRA